MFGATQDYVDTKWKPYFETHMDYLQIPKTVDTSKQLQESIDILNNKSYDEAVAYVRALTPAKIIVAKGGMDAKNIMLYAAGGGLLLASLFFLRKS